MKLQMLHNVACLFGTHKRVYSASRFNDNLLCLKLDKSVYFVDLSRSDPIIFMSDEMSRSRTYSAPFDVMLSRFVHGADITHAGLQGLNKVIELSLISRNSYSEVRSQVYIELINRISNFVIVVDGLVVAALHYNDRICVRKPYVPMPQPEFFKILDPGPGERDVMDSLKRNYDQLRDSALHRTRQVISSSLHSKLSKLRLVLDSLPSASDLDLEYHRTFAAANFILANLSSIEPYASFVMVDGQQHPIPPFPRPQSSADVLFKKAKKLRHKLQNIHLQEQNLRSTISFIENQIAFVSIATLQELEVLRQMGTRRFHKDAQISKRDTVISNASRRPLSGRGSSKNVSTRQGKKQYESFYIDGYKISIGRNEIENAKLLKDAKGDFIWMHIQHIPSSHLIIHSGIADEAVLRSAGTLLARLSGINESVVIDYTKRRFVHVIEGANVVYSKHTSFRLKL